MTTDKNTLAPAAQAATPPVAQDSGRRHTGRIVLALIVLLLLGGGTYAVVHRTRNKAVTPAAGDARTVARPNAIRAAAATDARGGSDPGKAPDTTPQAGTSVEQPGKSSGSADRTSDAGDSGQATGAMGGLLSALTTAVGGTHRHDPVDFHTLETLLPSSLPNMQPGTPDGNADETMSIKTTSAQVDFSGANDARIHLSIRDATAISGLAGLAEMASSDSSEQGDSYEKSETIDGRSVHEKWDAAARHGELSLSVGQRFAVDVVGDNVDMATLKNALARIDLAKLESMKDANPVTK